jgi:SPOR domain
VSLRLGLAVIAMVALAACSRQEADWSRARAGDSIAGYQQYLDQYPHGAHVGDAQARLQELVDEREWERALRLDTPEAYQAYLGGHPEGRHAATAREKLADFLLARTPTGGDAREPPPPAGSRGPSGTLAALAAPGGEFRVQLGAFAGGDASARKAWTGLQAAHAAELGRLQPSIDRVERGARSLWRLQAGPLTEERARAVCSALRARGADCLVVRSG